MDNTAWNLAKQVFLDALEETGPARIEVVESACEGDEELLALVMALLDAHEQAGDFLSDSAMASAILDSGDFLEEGESDGFSGPDSSIGRGRDPVEPEGGKGGESKESLPARIGPYTILGVLGTGGMGTVYRARDPDLHRELAIKVLSAELVSSQELARFEREAKLLASLNHPNIATIHAIGETDGRPYLILELIEGESLSQRLSRGPLDVEGAAEMAAQVAEAVEAAHESGIVHRDLKPANVMITSRGLVKVLDFGIAKAVGTEPLAPERREVTGDGTLMGTIPYMSPEQVTGREVGEHSDLWALGCLLYEALTGASPFDRSTLASTLVAIQREAPDLSALPDGTPQALKGLISECLEKDPSRRPDSAAAVRRLLFDTLAELRITSVADRSRLTWAAVGVLSTFALLVVAEGSILPAIINWVPPGARGFLADGGRLAALAATALVVVFLAVRALTGGSPAGNRRRMRFVVFGTTGVVALALLVPLGRWATARAKDLISGGTDVYVCLPFQGLDDEAAEDLLTISNGYRSTLEVIFDGVKSVTIQPAMYDPERLETLPPQCTFPRARAWLEGTGHDPDLVLCNDVNVAADTSGGEGMIVVSNLQRAYEGRLEGMGRIEVAGSMGDVRYLALTTGAQIVRTLQQEERFRLAPEEEAVVKDGILDEFGNFLVLQGPAGSDAAQVLDRFRSTRTAEGHPTVEDVMEVLETYKPNVSLDQYEEGARRTREALLQRFEGGR